jgi:glutamate-ammonia-ligase adenylyltransferase
MKPTIDIFRSSCPEVEESFIRDHILRLEKDYFSSFTKKDQDRHLYALSRLTSEHPMELLIDKNRDGSVNLTVLAFDYPAEFSLISGVLAGTGFNIQSGNVFTYKRRADEQEKVSLQGKRLLLRSGAQEILNRRRIIDHFSGMLESPLPFNQWEKEIWQRLESVIYFLEDGSSKSVIEVKNLVNSIVVKHLAFLQLKSAPVLYPVDIEIDNDVGPFTSLKIVSEDTPAFLYALSNALSIHGMVIEHVRIRTIHGRIEDRIDLLDSRGLKIEDKEALDRIKLSVLLTKQFTYFLSNAPDPFIALSRFEHMVKDLMDQPFQDQWISRFTDPRNLQDLAQLLGASDFLWEDFIHLQYESLLPIFRAHSDSYMLSSTEDALREKFKKELKDTLSFVEKKQLLNRIKDNEIFLIDLEHILNPDVDLRTFSAKLTILAELVVNEASRCVFDKLTEQYGKPMSVAGLNATYAVLGLGKFGGVALGYASDIELLFVYSDNGETDGKKSISNAEFFNRMVKGISRFIEAKREGIFQIDLRLRPYGNSGSLACSLENFCRYYGKNGSAHSFELLSLVRLRAAGGDKSLGERIERLRDEMVYFSDSIDFKELRDLREKQFHEKVGSGKNVKFSPGGLVDIEYDVQILQVMYAKNIPELRTARIHEALAVLGNEGVLSSADTDRLLTAYDFFRHLTNGMRMLRGSAKDLFLPPADSDEFSHLARRMDYQVGEGLDPGQQLYLDFETHTAVVRVFVERHFGRDSLPNPSAGTIADLVLSDDPPEDLRNQILVDAGFHNPERAYSNLRALAGQGSRRDTFARIAILAGDILAGKANPDMALNNWDRFVYSLVSPEFHYKMLLSQPTRLEILLSLFSESQFLADTLVRNTGFLDWLIDPNLLHNIRKREELEKELRMGSDSCSGHDEWLNKLRRFRRRETLRIGTRDICLQVNILDIMQELSILAEACTQIVLERRLEELKEKEDGAVIEELKNRFCIMAFGKLGGYELNYSSDIDLLAIWDSADFSDRNMSKYKKIFHQITEGIRYDLSAHTDEGYAYRVDLRLRPFGSAGELVPSVSALLKYYQSSAALWEIQAALKLRPIAGNQLLGYDFLKQVQPSIIQQRERYKIVGSIDRLRKEAIKASGSFLNKTVDVKSGLGGIRDAEFLVQGLRLVIGNTIAAIEALNKIDILPYAVAEHLKEDYIFLRRVEHYLQILEDRQIHAIPKDPFELLALARRMIGINKTADQFMELLNERLNRTQKAYEKWLLEINDE